MDGCINGWMDDYIRSYINELLYFLYCNIKYIISFSLYTENRHHLGKSGTNEGMAQSASDAPSASGAKFLEEPESMYYVSKSRPVTIKCSVKGADVLDFR